MRRNRATLRCQVTPWLAGHADLLIHLVTLAAALLVLLAIGRDQWFWWDEWAFLVPEHPGLLVPHVGHWSTSPLVLTLALKSVFGLNSYLPFLVVVLAVHLAVTHLLWRVMRRVGVHPALATAFAVLFALLGAAAENILWAFQVGYIGGMALGLASVLMVDRVGLTVCRSAVGMVMAVLSLTFAGTAIPLVVAGTIVVLVRRGRRAALLFAGIPGAVFTIWYLLVSRPADPSGIAVDNLTDALVGVPEFAALMYSDGYGVVLPVSAAGAAIVVLIVLWAVRNAALGTGRALAAYALVVASVVFAVMTAATRMDFGEGAPSLGRYVYAIVAMTMPLAALAVSAITQRRASRMAALVVICALTLYNTGKLIDVATFEASREREVREIFSASVALALDEPGRFDLAALPAPVVAPDVTLGDLLELHRSGQLVAGLYSSEARNTAKQNLEGISPRAHAFATSVRS